MQVVFKKINKFFFGPIFLGPTRVGRLRRAVAAWPTTMRMGDRPCRLDMSQKEMCPPTPMAKAAVDKCGRRRPTQVPYGATGTCAKKIC
jgi:hypothetical protein